MGCVAALRNCASPKLVTFVTVCALLAQQESMAMNLAPSTRRSTLDLEGIATRLGSFHLGPCSHVLERGQVTALIGGNGAGKSTLLGTIMGLVRPTAGTVRIGDVDHRRHEKEFRRLVGFAAQTPSFYATMRLSRLVRFASAFRSDWNGEACEDLMARLGLSATMRVGEMSVGTLKKVGILLALGHMPDFALLDEPTAGLDPTSRHNVLALLKATASAGRSVFFSTHIVDEAEQIADALLIIDRGKVMEQGYVADIRRGLGPGESLESHVIKLTM